MTLQARDIVARLGSFRLGPLSVDFPAGSVTALLGPNGSGKTTLLRVLACLQPHDGTVRIAGELASGLSIAARAARIAFVAQRPAVASGLSVHEVVSLGRLRLARDARAVQGALECTGLAELGDRAVSTLSAGQMHRVAVARALAQRNPRLSVLAMDEPTASLDPAWSASLAALLREQASKGLAVVVATHDLAFAAACCDRAVLLVDGSSRGAGPHAEVATPAALSQAFGTSFVPVDGLAPRPVALPRL